MPFESENFVTHPTRGIAMSNIVMRIFMMIYTNSHQTDVSISLCENIGVKIDVPDMVLCRFTLLCVVNLVVGGSIIYIFRIISKSERELWFVWRFC